MKAKSLEQAFAPAVRWVGRILAEMGETSLALPVGKYRVTVELLPADPAYIPSGRDGDAAPQIARPIFPRRDQNNSKQAVLV